MSGNRPYRGTRGNTAMARKKIPDDIGKIDPRPAVLKNWSGFKNAINRGLDT